MILNYLKPLYYEYLSRYVPQRVRYKVEGHCLQCGKCCRHMYSIDTYTEKEFKIMQFLYPSYKRFYIAGKDKDGHFIFACKYVQDDGKCSVYKKRLNMCKKYPKKIIHFNGIMHEGCGFKVRPELSFEDYLNI